MSLEMIGDDHSLRLRITQDHFSQDIYDQCIAGDKRDVKALIEVFSRVVESLAIETNTFQTNDILDSYSTSFLNANACLASKLQSGDSAIRKWSPYIIGEAMAMDILSFVSFSKATNQDVSYEVLCEKIAQGNWGENNRTHGECSKTCVVVYHSMKNWLPYPEVYKNGNFHPLESIQYDIQPAHVTITFPTGNLLAADWIRIPQFTEFSKAIHHSSINSIKGSMEYTNGLAEQGIVSVFSSNTSPAIFQSGDQLIVGFQPDDGLTGEFKEVGRVCTDLWWSTLIDEARLIEILASEVGLNEARSLVDQYLSENDVDRIKVNPGTYHLYFHGDPDVIQREFQVDGVQEYDEIEPIFFLSNKELQLTKKLELGLDLKKLKL